MTLFVHYGKRGSDNIKVGGEWGMHNPRWVPDEGSEVERYSVDPGMSHSEFSSILEKKNKAMIYFLRWKYGSTMGKTFQDGDIVQVERQPFYNTD